MSTFSNIYLALLLLEIFFVKYRLQIVIPDVLCIYILLIVKKIHFFFFYKNVGLVGHNDLLLL